MQKIIIASTCFLSIVLSSCSKNMDESESLTLNSFTASKKNEIIQIEENVGSIHNAFLDELEFHDDFYEFSNLQLVNIINAFFINLEIDSLSTSEKNNLLNYIDNIEPTTIAAKATSLSTEGKINEAVANHYFILDEIVSQNVSVSQMISNLNDFENMIISDEELTEFHRHSLLGTSIIARYSLNYWNEVYIDEQRGWHSILLRDLPNEGRTPIILATPRWLRDIIGYIDGFFDCESCNLSGRDRVGTYRSGVASGDE
jgi:hypothetical protein